MKLAAILANIDAIIARHKPKPTKNPDPVQQIFTEYVIQKLKKILNRKIGTNQNKLLNVADTTELITFMREVFEVVRDTDFIAPHDPNSLITEVLMALAKQIASVSKLNKYQILIPTLTETNYEASSTSLHDADLLLNYFVLSDDGTAIIEGTVSQCLQGNEEADLQVAITKTALKNAMHKPNYYVIATYGTSAYEVFLKMLEI